VNTAVARVPSETPMADAPSWQSRFFSPNNRYLPPLFITCILLAGQFEFGVLESGGRTLLAIATSIGMEIILSRLVLGKWPHLASAYISGISVGILVRSPFLWPYMLCSSLSILSKYAIRWRGRHIWNPSNFGVSAMLFLYPAAVASLSIQWGNTLWPMITVWCIGSVIIFRLRRFHICASYVGTFLFLSWIRSEVTGNPWLSAVAPLTGPMYQLFVFFMITDPPTTVRGWRSQCLVASLIAVAEMVLRLNGVVDAPYYALFLVGPVANVVDRAIRSQSAPPSPGVLESQGSVS